MNTKQSKKYEERKPNFFAFAVLFAVLALVATALGSASGATPPAEEWNKTFGGTGSDYARSVQQTTDGGYIVAGYTESYGAGFVAFWLVKTDANGNEQWNKTFGGTRCDFVESVQQTTDGGYILAGYTASYGAGKNDAWLVKTDSNGNMQWDRTFGGTDYDGTWAVQQTTDGGYILAGFKDAYGASLADAWLIKTDANGNKQWDRTFGGTNPDVAMAVQQTTGGGYIFAGYTESYGAGDRDFWLVKTDANGNKQWDRTFGGADWDEANSVQQTTSGDYILAGYTASYGAGKTDAWLVKTDSNGYEIWKKTFGGVSDDKAHSVQQTTDGGYIFAGSTSSYGAGWWDDDVWLVKTDANGNEEWNKTFGGTRGEGANSVQQTTDGGYILAGDTTSYGAGNYDFWLVKVKGKPVKPTVSVATNKPSYKPGETMTVTIGLKNPTASSVDSYFIWYLGLPSYGYWSPILSTPLMMLPPNFDQTYNFSILVGNWGSVGFDAVWYVALLEPTAPYATISSDTANWKYNPRTTQEAEAKAEPEEIAKQIGKELEGVEFAA